MCTWLIPKDRIVPTVRLRAQIVIVLSLNTFLFSTFNGNLPCYLTSLLQNDQRTLYLYRFMRASVCGCIPAYACVCDCGWVYMCVCACMCVYMYMLSCYKKKQDPKYCDWTRKTTYLLNCDIVFIKKVYCAEVTVLTG
jgi:hypothetical protein